MIIIFLKLAQKLWWHELCLAEFKHAKHNLLGI